MDTGRYLAQRWASAGMEIEPFGKTMRLETGIHYVLEVGEAEVEGVYDRGRCDGWEVVDHMGSEAWSARPEAVV